MSISDIPFINGQFTTLPESDRSFNSLTSNSIQSDTGNI